MKPLAKAVVDMRRSGIREIMDLAARRPGVIHLEVGQPDFATPQHIIEATCEAARAGLTKYTPNAGLDSLRQAVAQSFARKTGASIGMDNVVITTGAVGGVTSTLLALLDPGDEVLLPDPAWPNYLMAITSMHGQEVRFRLDPANGFLPNLSEIEALITERTKLILINSPSNPTGTVFSPDLMQGLVELAERYDLYLISDEIYCDIVFEGKHASAAESDHSGRAIVVGGFSKSYAMTGYRVGYIVTNPELAAQVAKLQEAYTSCVFGVAQKAAEAALAGPQDCVQEMCDAYRARRDAALRVLREYDLYRYTPGGAFYLVVDTSAAKVDSYQFALRLLEEREVAVAPGTTFGPLLQDHIRISLAASEASIVEGLHRICPYIWENAGGR